jgi:hypothetical protein
VKADGIYLKKFYGACYRLLHDCASWLALPRKFHTRHNVSTAFAMVSREACAVQGYMTSSGYPWRLWRLLDLEGLETSAKQIHDDPGCLHDVFAAAFLKEFDTVEKLVSVECRLCLMCIPIRSTLRCFFPVSVMAQGSLCLGVLVGPTALRGSGGGSEPLSRVSGLFASIL